MSEEFLAWMRGMSSYEGNVQMFNSIKSHLRVENKVALASLDEDKKEEQINLITKQLMEVCIFTSFEAFILFRDNPLKCAEFVKRICYTLNDKLAGLILGFIVSGINDKRRFHCFDNNLNIIQNEISSLNIHDLKFSKSGIPSFFKFFTGKESFDDKSSSVRAACQARGWIESQEEVLAKFIANNREKIQNQLKPQKRSKQRLNDKGLRFREGAFEKLCELLEGKIHPETRIWIDEKKANKSYLASLLKNLYGKNYYIKRPSIDEYASFCRDVLKIEISISTIKHASADSYDFSKIPSFI